MHRTGISHILHTLLACPLFFNNVMVGVLTVGKKLIAPTKKSDFRNFSCGTALKQRGGHSKKCNREERHNRRELRAV